MQCCGQLQDITTNDDRMMIYLCGECGKQGPSSAFPDPIEEPPQLTRFERIRLGAAAVLDRIAAFVAPK